VTSSAQRSAASPSFIDDQFISLPPEVLSSKANHRP
jgi:hypothetical protein